MMILWLVGVDGDDMSELVLQPCDTPVYDVQTPFPSPEQVDRWNRPGIKVPRPGCVLFSPYDTAACLIASQSIVLGVCQEDI